MSYSVENFTRDHPSTLPDADATPIQRLPMMYDTIDDARAGGQKFLEENKAPLGTVTFRVVDDGGDVVVPPTAGSNTGGVGGPTV